MTDNKAPLDALDRLAASITPYDRHPDIVKQDIDIVRKALTTPPAPTVMGDDVREAVEWASGIVKDGEQVECDYVHLGKEPVYVPYLKTLIRAATAPRTTDVLCRTCKGDPETCADVPDARRVYGFHNGKALSCHPPGVESAIETFLRFNGAVFVDGKPVEKFGIATGAMSSAIQAYLDYYRNGVGDTDETRKSY